MYQVGQLLETSSCTYEILSRADQEDCYGKINLFVKIIRTAIPYKGNVKYSCVTEDWLLHWVNTHLKYPLKDNMEYYSNNGTQLFEDELYTLLGEETVFKFTKRGEFGLIRVNGGLFIPFITIVDKGYEIIPY